MDLTAEIQIETVYQRNGTKPASIKDTQGNYFGIPDGAVGILQAGQAGTITYWVKQGQNRQFFNATKWNGQDLPKGQPAPTQQPIMQQPLHPQAVVNSPQQTLHTQESNDNKEEGMFVMGVVGRAMGSGQFSATDIHMLTKAATAAWRNRHSPAFGSNAGVPEQPFDEPVNRTEGGMPDYTNDPNYIAAG